MALRILRSGQAAPPAGLSPPEPPQHPDPSVQTPGFALTAVP